MLVDRCSTFVSISRGEVTGIEATLFVRSTTVDHVERSKHSVRDSIVYVKNYCGGCSKSWVRWASHKVKLMSWRRGCSDDMLLDILRAR